MEKSDARHDNEACGIGIVMLLKLDIVITTTKSMSEHLEVPGFHA